MKDIHKTHEQLLNELRELRQKNKELELNLKTKSDLLHSPEKQHHNALSLFAKTLKDLPFGVSICNESAQCVFANNSIGRIIGALHGFVLTTVLSPASVHDSKYFTYCTLYSRHTKHKLAIVYADISFGIFVPNQ